MGLRIQNNVEAFNAHRQLTGTASKAAKAMEKLSSGYRVNRAADDAAGLAISEKMRAQIGGLAQAQRNAQDGVSLVQTAEGSLNEVHSMLQRMRDLKVQYKNEVLDDDDKAAIVAEAKALTSEIRDIQSKTEFNGVSLHNASGTVTFQVGANASDTISVSKTDLTGTSGVGSKAAATADPPPGGPVHTPDTAAATKTVPPTRGESGPPKTRLEHRLNNLATYQENLVASESRIRDVDMA